MFIKKILLPLLSISSLSMIAVSVSCSNTQADKKEPTKTPSKEDDKTDSNPSTGSNTNTNTNTATSDNLWNDVNTLKEAMKNISKDYKTRYDNFDQLKILSKFFVTSPKYTYENFDTSNSSEEVLPVSTRLSNRELEVVIIPSVAPTTTQDGLTIIEKKNLDNLLKLRDKILKTFFEETLSARGDKFLEFKPVIINDVGLYKSLIINVSIMLWTLDEVLTNHLYLSNVVELLNGVLIDEDVKKTEKWFDNSSLVSGTIGTSTKIHPYAFAYSFKFLQYQQMKILARANKTT